MAVQTVQVDDLDGSEGAKTVHFGLDGKNYEVDLADENEGDFRSLLQPYIDAGRKVTDRVSKKKSSSNGSMSREDSKQIREWGAANGFKVNERGRIPADLIAAYEEAQKNPTPAPAKPKRKRPSRARTQETSEPEATDDTDTE